VVLLSIESVKRIEQRTGHDRRRRTLHALLVGGVRRRRRRVRRQEGGGIAAIDWYPARCFAVVFLILVLCCIDSFNTVTLLARGFIELNPLMRALIEEGGPSFVLIKLGLTAASLTALVILTRARTLGRISAGNALYVSAALYIGLVGYEFWLLRGLTLLDY
jgi:hypothetical protein